MHVALDALSQGLYESGLHGTNSQMLWAFVRDIYFN